MPLKVIQFWSYSTGDNTLLERVLAGKKRAIVSRLHSQRPGTIDPRHFSVGEEAMVQDAQQRLRGRIRVTDIYQAAFAAIPEKLWQAEGCCDAEHLQAVMRHGWPDELLDEDYVFLAMHFELVEVISD
ncbi:hypothetical protein C4K68_27230 [Pokkaliibacter plantistimulans]|uniref:ASCH domain-containing protein n=1 Tax=Proteobacteria bacterium 228 TaxID=2083153 RepID=A0A2S5KHX7_9PROT|nr:ASCH domain-containing protein [Pokkaliibacter plantistimulans]PPC74109.1 hypothetical protein C4K68_27230 [Pokkaliibacter plantistimulans]